MQYFCMGRFYKHIGILWYLWWNFTGKGNGFFFDSGGIGFNDRQKEDRVSEREQMGLGFKGISRMVKESWESSEI